MKKTTTNLGEFVAFIISTLPDGISARKNVLESLFSLLPKNQDVARMRVRMLIVSLENHEAKQLQFTLPQDGK